MRKLIVRFDSRENLEEFCKINSIDNLDESVLEYNLDEMEILKSKSNRVVRKKKSIDKHGCIENYVNMPEFDNKKILPYHKIIFHTKMEVDGLCEVFDQNVSSKSQSLWFPKLIAGTYSSYRAVGGTSETKYPIFVVSKGRHDLCHTSIHLSQMEVEHYVVVEPNEVELYKENLDTNFATVLELDLDYKDYYDKFDDLGLTKSTGPGPARNFCWDYSIELGFDWHWVFDDNANEGFHWFYQNTKIKCRSGAFFRSIENFVERYDNLAIAGINYSKFCIMPDKHPPFITNTRIYSFLLIRNDIPYRWRGRYNEDTDLSLNVLKDGWTTVQFNSFLAGKATTQKIKGGNTKEFYDGEGTLPKSQMLEDMHPDVAKVVWKFNRWHHHVDYTGFKQKLKLKEGVDLSNLPKVNNYGMKVIPTSEEGINNYKSELEERYFNEFENGEKVNFNKY